MPYSGDFKEELGRNGADERSDVWTWTGIDADTKLCLSYVVGGRSAEYAQDFMQDCANRIVGRVQITTDGHKTYLEAMVLRHDRRLSRYCSLPQGFHLYPLLAP
jgi:IS1 family transposase